MINVKKDFLEGFMAAARILGADDAGELRNLLEQAGHDRKEATTEQSRSTWDGPPCGSEDYLAIPTFIRRGKFLQV